MSDHGLTPSGKRWQPPTPEELHAQLPQYQIGERLGAGGMGAVYKGFQTSLERHVAIKILPPSLDEDQQYAQRFKQEAKTMARLSHPGIVGVHDCGQTESGLLYIVMEFVEGTDVQQMILRQGKLPPEQAMAVTLHVCEALNYAHENGVVHRDIKPANIMVDIHGRVKVADFGLAKSPVTNTGLSSTAMTLGTPDYVAPEALIMGVKVDQRADLYSVGVMLYEMLTGKVPRGRFKSASNSVPGLDPRYDEVIDRAMAEDREARYRGASELKADLVTIRTVPLTESGMRTAAAKLRSAPPARRPVSVPPTAEKSKTSLLLMTVGPLAVIALGLLIWSPWAAKEPPADGTPGLEKPVQIESKPPVLVDAHAPRPLVKPPQPPVTVVPAPSLDLAKPTPLPAPSSPNTGDIPGVASKVQPPILINDPAPAPLSEVKLSLVKLDEQFQAAAERDVGSDFKSKLSTLNKDYAGALERAQAAATKDGKSDEAKALSDEKARIEKEWGVPAEAADKDAPPKLKELRQTYRGTFDKHEADRIKSLQPLYDKYDQAFSYLETELTKAGKLDDAVWVKSFHARVPQLRLSGITTCLNPAGRKVVLASEVNISNNDPTGYPILSLRKDDFICLSEVKGSGLVITHASEHQGPVVGQAVPPEAASAPFIYVVQADHEKLFLRLRDPGKATCQLKVIRPSEAMFNVEAPSAALADSGYVNFLGMKFVPVPGTQILMCIHDTRRRDYAAFAGENPRVDGSWKNPARDDVALSRTEDDPVVGVSWEDAEAFCAWLGNNDGRVYRLPTDREWSVAVGIADFENEDASPDSLDQTLKRMYPWGTDWPPPKGAGNFADTSLLRLFPKLQAIPNYDDRFPGLAPVMSFVPNKLGIYDLGGNVWQWCEDWYDAQARERVMRGGCWSDNSPENLLSSRRVHHAPSFRGDSAGFRCVMVEKAEATPSVPAPSAPSTAMPVLKKVGTQYLSPLSNAYTNSLGMKFVAVPGTGLLMCVFETRKKDYAAYAAENVKVDEGWEKPIDNGVPISEGPDHPVVMVNWQDATSFCSWLSQKEGRLYRLPTDREWSFAVGIGEREARGDKLRNEFPWGKFWPPPKGAGNFADRSYALRFPPTVRRKTLDEDDGFAGTAPVMSFPPNRLGLYDMAGNAWEWCLDAYKDDPSRHILRGGAYNSGEGIELASDARIYRGDARRPFHGFRCVLDPR